MTPDPGLEQLRLQCERMFACVRYLVERGEAAECARDAADRLFRETTRRFAEIFTSSSRTRS